MKRGKGFVKTEWAAVLVGFISVAGVWGCDGADGADGDTDPAGGDGDADSESDERPACLSDPDFSLADEDADRLFGADHVPVFDIYLPKEAWEGLIEDAEAEVYIEAEVCFEGRRVGTTVGLRFKGSVGTLYSCFDSAGELICPRLSIKLKFNKYDDAQRFYGLKRLNFHANRHDDTRMREALAYDMFREMDIVAPRASWAVVRVNGESLGLYGMVEQIDGRFTENRWPDNPDANLYKEVWPTNSRGEIKEGLRTNEEEGDIAAFKAFSDAIAAADDDELPAVLAAYTDLDYWARYMAVDDALPNYDGVTYFWTNGTASRNHNYCFYEDSPAHFTLIPWDVESTFWINEEHVTPHWTERPDDCGITYPYWDGEASAPGCDPVFRALQADLSGWRAAARELLDGPFSEEELTARIDRYEAHIGEAARDDATPTVYGTFDEAMSVLRAVIPQLRNRLEKLIDEKGNGGGRR